MTEKDVFIAMLEAAENKSKLNNMDKEKTFKFECPHCGKEIETDEFDSYTTEKRYCRKCQKFVRFRLHNYLHIVKDPVLDVYYIGGPYVTNLN